MKISIITVCYNSAAFLTTAINSVIHQNNVDLEYIIVDGNSTDESLNIIKSYADLDNRIKWISEDDNGIYDAMNKGIKKATGEIIGILNSDDFYIGDQVLSRIHQIFIKRNPQVVFSDVRFIHENNHEKTVRYYSSASFNPSKFKLGFMPAHPTFFTYKVNFDKYGYYETNYEIASDYELLIRFLYTHKLDYFYLPGSIIKMRVGGISTKSIKSNITLNSEIIKACAANGIYTNMLLLSFKYFKKIFELVDTKNE